MNLASLYFRENWSDHQDIWHIAVLECAKYICDQSDVGVHKQIYINWIWNLIEISLVGWATGTFILHLKQNLVNLFPMAKTRSTVMTTHRKHVYAIHRHDTDCANLAYCCLQTTQFCINNMDIMEISLGAWLFSSFFFFRYGNQQVCIIIAAYISWWSQYLFWCLNWNTVKSLI